MNEIGRQLLEIAELRAAPPPGLIERARSKAPALAEQAKAHRRRVRKGATVAIAATGALALTPAGQAATEWLGELAGIGDEPTLEHPDARAATVLLTGEDPRGAGYELVVVRGEMTGHRPEFVTSSETICFRLDFPAESRSAGETCVLTISSEEEPTDQLTGPLWAHPPDSVEAMTGSAPIPWWGSASAAVDSVEVVINDGGDVERYPLGLILVSGELREQVGSSEDFSVFVGFPPIPNAPYDEGFEVETIAYDANGAIVKSITWKPEAERFGGPYLQLDDQEMRRLCGDASFADRDHCDLPPDHVLRRPVSPPGF